jgi:hypothetical protein
VTPNPALEVDKHLPHVVISPLIPKMPANAGADATFKFRVADKKTDAPVTGVSDLVIVIMAPNNWHTRQIAKEEGGGVYSVVVTPPQAGVYYAHAQCLSLNVQFGNPNYSALQIVPGKPGEPRAGQGN